MVLLDTNAFIYLAHGKISIEVLPKDDLAFASITKIEALGYAKATVQEKSYLEELFEACTQLDLHELVIQRAIIIRQQNKIHLADAIIAATAIENNCELWTANIDDFKLIHGLHIHNPLFANE